MVKVATLGTNSEAQVHVKSRDVCNCSKPFNHHFVERILLLDTLFQALRTPAPEKICCPFVSPYDSAPICLNMCSHLIHPNCYHPGFKLRGASHVSAHVLLVSFWVIGPILCFLLLIVARVSRIPADSVPN